MPVGPQGRFRPETGGRSAPGEGSSEEPGARIWTVQELNRRVRDLLLESFGTLWVEGELSGVKYYRSGGRERVYGTLKDAQAEVRIVLWEESVAALRFRLEDGQKVLLLAEVTLYPQRGQFQLIVQQVRPSGIGELELAFQQLRERLEREGLFDPARKRPLPARPFRVGVVTSRQAAALHDFLQITGRRNPALRILIAPARVQGEGAAAEIVAALQALQRVPGLDCIVLTRGGGSLEDLWPFNEEIVARAVAASRLPVVSAVGHEVDTTICDLVADLRAPTPSAAAELIAWPLEAALVRLVELSGRAATSLRRRMGELDRQVRWFSRSHGFLRMLLRVQEAAQQTDEALRRLPEGLRRRLETAGLLLRESPDRLQRATGAGLERRALRLDQLGRTIRALSPTAVLERGYAIARRPGRGPVIRSAVELEPGTPLEVYLREGRAEVRVEGTGPGLESLRGSGEEPDRPGDEEP